MASPENEVDAQIREEFEFHVARCVQELERSGMPHDAALAEALRRFGDPRLHGDACRREAPEERMRKVMLGGVAVVMVLLCATVAMVGYTMMRQGEALARIEERLAKGGGSEGDTSPGPEQNVVYVDGAVRRPGVYNLPESGALSASRLISAAGGPVRAADYCAFLLPKTLGPARIAKWKLDGGRVDVRNGEPCMVIECTKQMGTTIGDPKMYRGDSVYVVDSVPTARGEDIPTAIPAAPQR